MIEAAGEEGRSQERVELSTITNIDTLQGYEVNQQRLRQQRRL